MSLRGLSFYSILATIIIETLTVVITSVGIYLTIKNNNEKIQLETLQKNKLNLERHINQLQKDSAHHSPLFPSKI